MSEKKIEQITEKNLLVIFDYGINCLAECRNIDYNIFKKIEKLLFESKIIIKIKKF